MNLVEHFFYRLIDVNRFNREALLREVGETRELADIALWKAQETLARDHNKRFVRAREPGEYIVGDPEKRTRRVQKRRRAAGRVLSRSLEEVRRIQAISGLTSEIAAKLEAEERKLGGDVVREKIEKRRAERSMPAGL